MIDSLVFPPEQIKWIEKLENDFDFIKHRMPCDGILDCIQMWLATGLVFNQFMHWKPIEFQDCTHLQSSADVAPSSECVHFEMRHLSFVDVFCPINCFEASCEWLYLCGRCIAITLVVTHKLNDLKLNLWKTFLRRIATRWDGLRF